MPHRIFVALIFDVTYDNHPMSFVNESKFIVIVKLNEGAFVRAGTAFPFGVCSDMRNN